MKINGCKMQVIAEIGERLFFCSTLRDRSIYPFRLHTCTNDY